jgi:hypothetical protein
MKATLRHCVNGQIEYDVLFFWCPACDKYHSVNVNHPNGWGWNGSLNQPTITPSILVTGGYPDMRCQSFVTDGKIQYLSDCSHGMAGQTVELPDTEM